MTKTKTPAKQAEEALADLLKQDAELHAKIAKAASGVTGAVIRESLTASLGHLDAPQKPRPPAS